MMEAGFGRSVPRLEDTRLLTGRGCFTADLFLPGQAHAYVLRSPHSHAMIRGVDAADAKAAPGVLLVLIGADAAADRLGQLPRLETLTNSDGSPPVSHTPPILARDRVRYVGEPVAFIVAERPDQAVAAAESIKVDYEALPAVTDTATAAEKDAPQLWPDAPGNLALDWSYGDAAATEQAFSQAARVTRLALVNQRLAACPMEPPAIVATHDTGDGRSTLHAQTQGVHAFRRLLANDIFGIEEQRLRVLTPDVGGTFGVRSFPTVEHALVLWAARRLQRPVKWVGERSEAMVSELHGRDHATTADLALDSGGRMTALRVDTVANLGAYVTPFARIVPTTDYISTLTSVYRIPALHVRVRCVHSNTLPVTAYRGAGQPEAMYVLERLIDVAAAERGESPVDLRRRNLVPASAMPFATPTGETYDVGDFAHNLDRALALADAAGFAVRRAQSRAAGRRRGLGVALYMKNNEGAPEQGAEVRLDGAGRATVLIGTQGSGQGHETTFAQLVAVGLGVRIEQVQVVEGDSERIRLGGGTGGSSGLAVGGSAIHDAVVKVIAAGRPAAARLLECAEADIEFADGRYRVAGTDRTISILEVAKTSPLAEFAVHKAKRKSYANGCHVCEVEVDPETGRVTLDRYSVADDAGRLLHPAIVEGQLHGGLAQGIGQALMESVVFDPESGQLLSGSLMDYAMPRAADLPAFTLAFNEIACTTNPLGVKGVGESGTTGALAAVVNAVVDALREVGVRHIDMPLSPSRVWAAIRAQSGRPNG